MGKDSGFLLTARKLYSDPLYEEMQSIVKRGKPVIGYYRFQGLQDLFRRANFTQSSVVIGNRTKTIERGQVFISIQKLAKEWGWSRHRVNNFLKYLEAERDTIRTQKGHNHTLITICKYDEYQDIQCYLGHNKDTKRETSGHQRDTNGTHHKKVKELKEKREELKPQESSSSLTKYDELLNHWNNTKPKKGSRMGCVPGGVTLSSATSQILMVCFREFILEQLKMCATNLQASLNAGAEWPKTPFLIGAFFKEEYKKYLPEVFDIKNYKIVNPEQKQAQLNKVINQEIERSCEKMRASIPTEEEREETKKTLEKLQKSDEYKRIMGEKDD